MAYQLTSGQKAAAPPRRRFNNLQDAQTRLLQRQMEAEMKEVLEKISTLSCVDEEVSRLLSDATSAATRAEVIRGSAHPEYNDQVQLR